MDVIISFIQQNQLLSGSVGVILVAIISLFTKNKLSKRRNQSQKIGNNSKGYQAGRDINIK